MTYECRLNLDACTRRGGSAMLRRLEAGFATLGRTQFLPGCSVLLADEPGAVRLSDLPRRRRLSFLSDLDRLGEAVERSCRLMDEAFRHVDLEIVGDGGRSLHAHVWPRFAWEPADMRDRPVRLYPPERWSDRRFRLGPHHEALRRAIGSELDRTRRPEAAGFAAGCGQSVPPLGGVESLLIEVFTTAGRASGAALSARERPSVATSPGKTARSVSDAARARAWAPPGPGACARTASGPLEAGPDAAGARRYGTAEKEKGAEGRSLPHAPSSWHGGLGVRFGT